MSRKLRWAATSMPAMRRIMAAAADELVHRHGVSAQQLQELDPHARRQLGNILGDGADEERMAWSLRASDLYWVTHQMTRVAMDAARDVPVFAPATAPTTCGIMAFEAGLPAMGGDGVPPLALLKPGGGLVQHHDPVPVDVVSWSIRGDSVHIDAWCRSGHLPLPLLRGGSELAPTHGMQIAGGRELVDGSDRPDVLGLLSLLAAAWHLMQIPTLAERKSLDAEWGGVASDRTRPDRLVTTIDLRPLRHVTTDDDRTDDVERRRLSVRHYVRGHWRNQACGPNRSERRLTYVEPYIKGPEWAPLKHSEKVMVWRR